LAANHGEIDFDKISDPMIGSVVLFKKEISSRKPQSLSPVLPLPKEQRSDQGADKEYFNVDNVFPNNDEDEVNLSLRDNQAAVLSLRSRNINLRTKKDDKSKVSKVARRDSMIRNLVRLTSDQADNVRVYNKSTPSYEQI
jgi:hypothetical protein